MSKKDDEGSPIDIPPADFTPSHPKPKVIPRQYEDTFFIARELFLKEVPEQVLLRDARADQYAYTLVRACMMFEKEDIDMQLELAKVQSASVQGERKKMLQSLKELADWYQRDPLAQFEFMLTYDWDNYPGTSGAVFEKMAVALEHFMANIDGDRIGPILFPNGMKAGNKLSKWSVLAVWLDFLITENIWEAKKTIVGPHKKDENLKRPRKSHDLISKFIQAALPNTDGLSPENVRTKIHALIKKHPNMKFHSLDYEDLLDESASIQHHPILNPSRTIDK